MANSKETTSNQHQETSIQFIQPNMTKQFIALIFILLITSISFGQKKIEINLKNTTFVSSGDSLPFWFWANQYGTVNQDNQVLNLSHISVGNKIVLTDPKKLSVNWGTSAVAGLGRNNYLQLNEAFAAANWLGWKLEAGLFNDTDNYNGLSSSNGIVVRSLNALPYPKIRFSTNEYLPVPYIGQWMKFKAEYDEGILNDDRYVHNTRLHHKSLYASFTPDKSWKINIGVEHYAMWGGVSKNPAYSKLPADFHAYLLYITGSTGNEEFPETDQINVAGNQIGDYQGQIIKEFDKFKIETYISHWFEDHSGLVWRNWKDNLLGIKVDIKREHPLLSSFLYEFLNTSNQSVADSFYMWNKEKQLWETMETDFYFQHGVYRSGFSYQKMMMSSPLFIPQFQADGQMNIPSDRLYTHHLGATGFLNEALQWKGLLTFTHYLGTYWVPYHPVVKMSSFLLSFQYSKSNFPVNIGLSVASDISNLNKTNTGVQLSISKTW